MFHSLPLDVIDLIHRHVYAMTIQKNVRKWFLNHTYNPAWKHLRRSLLTRISKHEYNILAQNANIRKEWKIEPSSWIFMLHYEYDTVNVILQEIKEGLWSRSHVSNF